MSIDVKITDYNPENPSVEVLLTTPNFSHRVDASMKSLEQLLTKAKSKKDDIKDMEERDRMLVLAIVNKGGMEWVRKEANKLVKL